MSNRPTNDRASRDLEDAAIDGLSATPGMAPIGKSLQGLQKLNDYATAQYEQALRTARDPHASADEKRKAEAVIQRTEHRHGRP
jgi:hypothetical protein